MFSILSPSNHTNPFISDYICLWADLHLILALPRSHPTEIICLVKPNSLDVLRGTTTQPWYIVMMIVLSKEEKGHRQVMLSSCSSLQCSLPAACLCKETALPTSQPDITSSATGDLLSCWLQQPHSCRPRSLVASMWEDCQDGEWSWWAIICLHCQAARAMPACPFAALSQWLSISFRIAKHQ